jgi:HJR/Mrr/RecB family endonuclease
MKEILDIVCKVLAAADIIAFILNICRPMKKILGVGGVRGTLAGLLGSGVFAGITLLLLRREVTENLAAHPLGAAALYLALLVLMIFCLVRSHRKKGLLTLDDIDLLDGADFEKICAYIMLLNGFENIRQTKASGDFGVDILAECDGVLYGVQCKRYNRKLNSRPIQEISAGINYYECDVGAVMTNSTFTAHAQELAEAVGIELWDREILAEWLMNMNEIEKTE